MKKLIEKLRSNKNLKDEELAELLESEYDEAVLFSEADSVRKENYGMGVYLRGLIEFSNYCKNNCYYCGIRAGNQTVQRYRMTMEEILECCAEGYGLGYRTFVLQSGEDAYYTDDVMCQIVSVIKYRYPECAITLSMGERSFRSFQSFFNAGADRYLLRHETANEEHYGKLHPEAMSFVYRRECLFELKKIGYQVGAGFMVGSPFQTMENLIEDLRFLQELKPDMIGIGPFLSASHTPFKDYPNGNLKTTLRLIAILRLMFPYALIPATTALGTIHPMGREMGLKAGANVVMPNLSPVKYRKSYELYDNKICTGEESAQCISCLERRVEAAGYHISRSRGDVNRKILTGGKVEMTREEAWNLLTEYNKEEFHLEHAQIVEQTMMYFAEKLGYGDEKEFWGIVGLLHDLDFEQYPEQHCIKSQEIMREHGVDEKIIHATASHGYEITVDIKPEHEMEKVLYAVDELTGLIGAVVLMRPSKSVQDLELKSVKKKFKAKGFAAGCDREVIQRGADMLGWTLDELILQTIEALRTFQD